MKYRIFASLIMFLAIFNLSANEVDAPAPDFTLKNLDGVDVSLSDFKGKVVVLDFWASWCGPCREEFPFLIELAKENIDKDFTILAVNIDTKIENCKKFIDKQKEKPLFPILSDTKGKIPELYKVENMPTTYIIDRSGQVRFIHKGFAESYKEEYRKQIEYLLSEK